MNGKKSKDAGPDQTSSSAETTQWQKGTSGNPKGRPKKTALHAIDIDIEDMIVAESLKPIQVTEGGKAQSLPAVQAVKRAQLVSALKGNSHAMRSYLQQAEEAQARKRKRKEDAICAAYSVQLDLEARRIEWVAAGRPEDDISVHPSDIEIDTKTGEVKYFLALTANERRTRAKLVDLRDYLLMMLERSVVTIAEEGDDIFLQIGRDMAHSAISEINSRLPSRFRRFPPDAAPPICLDDSPEKIWAKITKPVTEFLFGL